MQALEGDDRYEEVLHTLQAEEKKEGIKMSEVLDRVENRGIIIGESRGIVIGESRGIVIGEKRGREKMAHEINTLAPPAMWQVSNVNTLYAALLEQNRMDDLKRAITDTDYQRQLLSEYGISDNEDNH